MSLQGSSLQGPSLQGPLVLVADRPAAGLLDALATAGAFPIVETSISAASSAIAAAKPAAIVLAEATAASDAALAQCLSQTITPAAPIVPVIAWLPQDGTISYREALPVAADAAPASVAARLSAALRVRALHGLVLRRAEAAKAHGQSSPAVRNSDPLEDAIVIVAGRGRSYPSLAVTVGERTGLIGALSVETAARYLKARDVDGLVIGDGFSLATLRAFLTALAESKKFRDLPIGLLNGLGVKFDYDLPGLMQASDPQRMLAHILPYIRLHAFESRLKRLLASLDAQGMLDPDTGLLQRQAFAHDLDRAVADARRHSTGLSLARFVLDAGLSVRAGMDAARIVSSLVRQIDFGCREDDGSLLVAFTETDLRHAHVIARRIAVALRRTMLSEARPPAAPAVTLAALKSSDTAASLLARVSVPAIAAE